MRYTFFLMVLFIVSCAPIKVNYDYDETVNFSQYKTYNYYSDIKTGLSELDSKRLFVALDHTLQKQGFSMSDTPDFYIDIQSSEYQESNRNSVGVGVGVAVGVFVGVNKRVGRPLTMVEVFAERIPLITSSSLGFPT